MKTGERWSYGKFWKCWLTLLLPVLLWHASGCAKDRVQLDNQLLLQRDSVERDTAVTECYRVGCPDVIELQVNQRPELSGRCEIAPDGRIDLGEYGKLRVEGRTLPEVARKMAAEVGSAEEHVQVRVIEYRNAHVILFGEVAGLQRSIPYHGPETVVDLLHRVGGITVGAAPKDVYVVRPHLGDSQRPEVFHVDLQAIVVKHEHKTNLRLLPYDQIYVGETRQAKVEKALPPWLRSIYQAIWETRPNPQADAHREEPTPSRWIEGKKATEVE